jgi:hypothetical protein
MQIGIFETDHFEGSYPVIKLFDNGQNEITIFTHEKSYRQFKHLFKGDIKRYTWIVKKPSESKYHFIYRIYKKANQKKLDFLYLNTISDNHIIHALMIARLRNMRVITTLHDVNGYFSFEPSFRVRRWVRYIGKKNLVRQVKEFNVVSSTMVEYLRNKLPSDKKVHCIPGCVFEQIEGEETTSPTMSPIKIVVPGTIDRRRRNYELVFDLLEKINKTSIEVRVVLLGGVSHEHGNSIIARCRAYASRMSNLQFFERDVVEQPLFDHEMNEAHLVLIPSVVNTVIADGISETYGLSISSGVIFDVIKHAKPFIVPRKLTVPADLNDSCFAYSSIAELAEFLKDLLLYPEKYGRWSDHAIINSNKYTIEKIREKNVLLFGGN